MPERIQLRRTKGWRKPPGAVNVARPTKWGNPFKGERAAEEFRRYLAARRHPWTGWVDLLDYPSDDEIKRELRGKVLGCWCGVGLPCHADVLLELANA